jgi:hypothetical protein
VTVQQSEEDERELDAPARFVGDYNTVLGPEPRQMGSFNIFVRVRRVSAMLTLALGR